LLSQCSLLLSSCHALKWCHAGLVSSRTDSPCGLLHWTYLQFPCERWHCKGTIDLTHRRWYTMSLHFVRIQWVVRPRTATGFCYVSFDRRHWQIWCLLSCLNPLGFC
jgi:hypothetical protein